MVIRRLRSFHLPRRSLHASVRLLLLAVSIGLLSVAATSAEPALHSDARPVAQPQRTRIVAASVQGDDLVFTLAAVDPSTSPPELLGTPLLRFPGRVGEIAGTPVNALPTDDPRHLRLAFPLAELPQHERYAAILSVPGLVERLPTETSVLASDDLLTLPGGQQFTLAVQEPSTTSDAFAFSVVPIPGTSPRVLPSQAYLQQGDMRLDVTSTGAVFGLDLRPTAGSLHFPREQALAMLQHADTELVITEYLHVSDVQHRLDLRFTSDDSAPPPTPSGTPTTDPHQPTIVVVTPAATTTAVPPIEVRPLSAPVGDVIPYPCSVECPITVVADDAPR